MKTENYIRSLVKYSTLSVLTLSSILYAIERPSPPVHPVEKIAPSELEPKANAKKISYLGVFGEPISDTLTAHLNLAEGIGIELEIVVANSPAAMAGLNKRDIITRLAGKDIASQDELRASIADKKPGDTVKLNYISNGKAFSTNLTLGTRPAQGSGIADAGQKPKRNHQPLVEMAEPALPKEFLEKFPKKEREKLMKLLRGKLKGLDLQELQQGLDKLEGFNLNLLPEGLNPEINKGLKIRGRFNSRFKMIDKQGSVTLEASKAGKVIELLDKKGKLQYRGPYNNDEDKMKVPKELRNRVKNLDINIGPAFPKTRNINGFNELKGDKKNLNFGNIEKLDEILEMMDLGKAFQHLLHIPNVSSNRLHFHFDGKNISSSSSTMRTDPITGNRYSFKVKNNTAQVEVTDLKGTLL